MPYVASAYSRPTSKIERFPWLTALFLAGVFFFSYHDLYWSRWILEAGDASSIAAAIAEGSLTHRIAFLVLGFFAVVSLVRHRGAQLRINGLLGRIMLLYAAWAVLSLAWAEDASLTFRRLVIFVILCLAAAAIARRFSLREIVLLMFVCSMLFLLVGLSAEVALGTFRPFTPGYRFAGTLHPNREGINCALLLLSGVAAADTEKHRRMFFRACALLGLVFLVFTGSRAAFWGAILALAAYLYAVCSRRAKTAFSLGLGIAICVLLMDLGNAPLSDLQSAVLLGRNDSTVATLTGRTGIWEDVDYYIHQRPILGYGYRSFWTPGHVREISASQGWAVGAAHSAYIGSLLDLGSVGLATFVLVLLGGVARSFTHHRASHAPAFAFSGAFLIFCLADGLLDSVMLEGTSLMFLSITVLVRLAFVCRPEASASVNRRSMLT